MFYLASIPQAEECKLFSNFRTSDADELERLRFQRIRDKDAIEVDKSPEKKPWNMIFLFQMYTLCLGSPGCNPDRKVKVAWVDGTA